MSVLSLVRALSMALARVTMSFCCSITFSWAALYASVAASAFR